MKKLIRPDYLPMIATSAGLLGFALRLWTLSGGPDTQGLYAPQPLAWGLLWAVTALTLGGFLYLSAQLREPGDYSDNFPANPISALGCIAAAVGILVTALPLISGLNWLEKATGLLGLGAAVAMGLVAWARWNGKVPNFLCHLAVSLFFALRIFDCCKAWSNEPQLGIFVMPFLACVCVMLAAYQLSCFDVNLPKRKACVFWSLSAVYFSILAMPNSEELLLHGCMAIWLLTNLCSLKPMKKREDTQEQDAPLDEAE